MNWKDPFTYLAILGAVGAPSTFWQVAKWLKSIWKTTLVQFWHPAIFKDFYFTTRDFGYRILEDGQTYLCVRRETIVSKKKNLESIPINYNWSGVGQITEEIEPSSLRLQDRPKLAGKIETRKNIVFEKPLGKREECSLILRFRCVATDRQPQPYISSTSKRRVDKLILRVAFPLERLPTEITYRLLDGDGVEKSHSSLECSDYLTGEYRIEIKYPKPFYEHRIEWTQRA